MFFLNKDLLLEIGTFCIRHLKKNNNELRQINSEGHAKYGELNYKSSMLG